MFHFYLQVRARPDDHIIEFAESMENVVLRLYALGLGVKENVKKSVMSIDFIKMVLDKQ